MKINNDRKKICGYVCTCGFVSMYINLRKRERESPAGIASLCSMKMGCL